MVYGLLILLTQKSVCKSHTTAFKLIQCEHLPQVASRAKNPIFGGTTGFHTEQKGNSMVREGSKPLYMIFTENPFSLTPFKSKVFKGVF